MKKLLLAFAVVSTVACSTLPKGDPEMTQVTPFTDTGNPDALVCDSRLDAMQFVTYAGNQQGREFAKFIGATRKADRCRFLNNGRQIQVTGYDPVLTRNGVLFIVEFNQDGRVLYSSSNYFPKAGPLSLEWERQLLEAPK